MKLVSVIEYRLPNGNREEQFLEVPDDIAELIEKHSFSLSAEMLTTGQVAIYCGPIDPNTPEDENIAVGENDGKLSERFSKLIRETAKLREDYLKSLLPEETK